jgi:hypothetical protein
MDSFKEMNEALDYIEGNLTNDIDFKKVAKLACCSEYHFSRMFSFLSGITLSEWAVFKVIGLSSDAQNIWGRIYSEWFLSSNYYRFSVSPPTESMTRSTSLTTSSKAVAV